MNDKVPGTICWRCGAAAERVRTQPGIPEQMRCSLKCGWVIVASTFGAEGFQWTPQQPAICCWRGHEDCWLVQKRFGRLDCVCIGDNRGKACGERKSVGPLRGFLNGRHSQGRDYSRLRALLALEEGGAQSLGILAERCEAYDLSPGQVAGTVRRGLETKTIARGPQQWVPPGVMGRRCSMTSKGIELLAWAVQMGKVSGRQLSVVEDLEGVVKPSPKRSRRTVVN